MSYVLLAVVVLFVAYIAWSAREARQEREQAWQAHRVQTSELLTRIAHPEVVLVPADEPKKVSTPDVEPEPDGYNDVGTIVPGLPE